MFDLKQERWIPRLQSAQNAAEKRLLHMQNMPGMYSRSSDTVQRAILVEGRQ